VVEGLQDSFQRLIAHGLAEYHSLVSYSRPLEGGGKEVVVRRHRGQAAGAGAASPGACQAQPASPEAVEGQDAAAAGRPRPCVLEIACSDILHILVDGPQQPLSAALLRQAYLQPLDTASEPGDMPSASMLEPLRLQQMQAQGQAQAETREQQAACPLHPAHQQEDQALQHAPPHLASPLREEKAALAPLADASRDAASFDLTAH
jgi:hypothetical protein